MRGTCFALIAAKVPCNRGGDLISGFLFLPTLSLTPMCSALPTLDIAEGALNALIDVYKELLPKV